MKDAETTSLRPAAARSRVSGLRVAIASTFGAVVFTGIACVLIFWDEILLAAPIIFLVKIMGFWPAYVAFVAIWMTMNVTSLVIFDRVWTRIQPRLAAAWGSLKRSLGMHAEEIQEFEEREGRADGWRMRIVLWLANVFRPLGAVASGIFLGGPFGAPMYRALGYNSWAGYAWIVVMTPVYGLVWVSFYGRGGVAVIDLLQGWL